jgi:hypothetical protein
METFPLVTASVALLTRLVGLSHGLLPQRRRPRPHVLVAGDRLDAKMIRQGFEALDQKARKPLESDPDSATNTAQ